MFNINPSHIYKFETSVEKDKVFFFFTSGTTTISSTGATATAPKLRAQYSAATCIKVATDTWYVVGDIA